MYMHNNKYNVNFGVKLDTGKVLEVTTRRIFQSDGIEGCKEVVNALVDTPIKATGHKGYRHYAVLLGNEITEKYPQIKDATDTINKIVSENPDITKAELSKKVEPLIEKIGKEIDIVI